MGLSIERDCQIISEHFPKVSGFNYMVGCDEAGRGPLAGTLMVAGVLFDEGVKIEGIFDSKKISERKRDELAEEIKEKARFYHIEEMSLEEIEKYNIYQASKIGMIRCFEKMTKDFKKEVEYLLTDAMKISYMELPKVNVIPLIKGDQKSFHIAAASILAKTARDATMMRLHEEYPQYGWDKNKGYPTKNHRLAIKEFGITKYHRTGFKLL